MRILKIKFGFAFLSLPLPPLLEATAGCRPRVRHHHQEQEKPPPLFPLFISHSHTHIVFLSPTTSRCRLFLSHHLLPLTPFSPTASCHRHCSPSLSLPHAHWLSPIGSLFHCLMFIFYNRLIVCNLHIN